MTTKKNAIPTLQTVEDVDAVLSRAEREEWSELFLCQGRTIPDFEFQGQAQGCRGEPVRPDRCFRISCRLIWDVTRVARLVRLRYLLLLHVRAVRAITIADYLHEMPELVSLDLTYAEMGAEGVVALVKNLGRIPKLTALDLGGTGLGNAGIQKFAEGLGTCQALSSLDLPVNEIGAAGARALAENLHKIPVLTTLNLGGNGIGDAGAVALAKHIRQIPGLSSLILWQNGIGERGIRALAEAWRDGHLKGLQRIDLSPNPLPVPDEVLSSNSPSEIFAAILQGRELHEANLVILGDPDVGKTWLCERVFLNRMPNQRQETHDFELHDSRWKPIHTGGQPISLKVWDFGGQHILHGLHEMFLAH